jgi:hypothetical protein
MKKRYRQARAIVFESVRPHVSQTKHMLVRPALTVLVLDHEHHQVPPDLAGVALGKRWAHASTPALAVTKSL